MVDLYGCVYLLLVTSSGFFLFGCLRWLCFADISIFWLILLVGFTVLSWSFALVWNLGWVIGWFGGAVVL